MIRHNYRWSDIIIDDRWHNYRWSDQAYIINDADIIIDDQT